MPWMDYEFQVIASNILGSGEPSMPSHTIRTQQAGDGRSRFPVRHGSLVSSHCRTQLLQDNQFTPDIWQSRIRWNIILTVAELITEQDTVATKTSRLRAVFENVLLVPLCASVGVWASVCVIMWTGQRFRERCPAPSAPGSQWDIVERIKMSVPDEENGVL